MLEAMETSWPRKAKWEEPKGGLFLWVKLPRGSTRTRFSMTRLRGVSPSWPGSLFFSKPVHNYLRLNYSLPSEEDIVTGIPSSGRLLKEKLQ